VEVHILGAGDDPADLARGAAKRGAPALGAAGGDGSLAAVASVALERDLPFACVPLGTRNHFARDAGLDADDPLGAVLAFHGRERRVDVGAVGDRVFLNNVSLGLYAAFVHEAEHGTRNRLTALLRTVPAALGRSRPPLELSFDVEGRRERLAAFIVLVANNDYRLERLADVGERTRLDEGLLHAYVIEAASRRALLGVLLHAAFGNVEEAEGLRTRTSTSFRLEAGRPRIHAAIDGEPAVLEAPLEFEIRPRALRLLLPPA